jgi:hypothetical protein
VKGKKSGSLLIKHTNGDQGGILLMEGQIRGIKVGNLTGKEAAKRIAMWLSFSTQFTTDTQLLGEAVSRIDTSQFLALLAKIAQKTAKIQKKISLDGVISRSNNFDFDKKREFNPEEVTLLLAINDKTSVGQVVANSGIPEFRALSYIYKFYSTGLVKHIQSQAPLDQDTTKSFLSSVTEFLSEQVGPAADIIVSDAFEYLESEPQLIYKSEIPEVIQAISLHLDDEEGLVFKKWALDTWGRN